MKHRIIGLALLCACPALQGCETLHHELRWKAKDTEPADDGDSKEGAVNSEPSKGFFHNTRLSGALSDEGRDIERNLGVK